MVTTAHIPMVMRALAIMRMQNANHQARDCVFSLLSGFLYCIAHVHR